MIKSEIVLTNWGCDAIIILQNNLQKTSKTVIPDEKGNKVKQNKEVRITKKERLESNGQIQLYNSICQWYGK